MTDKDDKKPRVISILERWVSGEITSAQADRELEISGVKLPKPQEKRGNIG